MERQRGEKSVGGVRLNGRVKGNGFNVTRRNCPRRGAKPSRALANSTFPIVSPNESIIRLGSCIVLCVLSFLDSRTGFASAESCRSRDRSSLKRLALSLLDHILVNEPMTLFLSCIDRQIYQIIIIDITIMIIIIFTIVNLQNSFLHEEYTFIGRLRIKYFRRRSKNVVVCDRSSF